MATSTFLQASNSMTRYLRVVACLLLATIAAAQSSNCPGYVKCPTADDFPLPYNGNYPNKYTFMPGMTFPEDFTWGVGTASYQIEGAYRAGNRGASIWDTFSGANTVGMPGSVCTKAPCPVSSVMKAPGATGNVANDHYHKYKDDVVMMKSMGVKTYRFSMAWPRIVPTGRFQDGTSLVGIAFYHNLLDELHAHGIEPVVTMYHWDLPQGLMDQSPGGEVLPPCDSRYRQGWYECTGNATNPVPRGIEANIVSEFEKYGEFLLQEFGSKVKTWMTFNEAWTFTYLASGSGKAPSVQPYMDGHIWPYVAGHNVIVAHAKVAAKFYDMKRAGKLSKEHKLGITNNQDWKEPASSNGHDIAAAEVQIEAGLGWYADPIYGVNGTHDYPQSMKLTKPYMPEFTEAEKQLLKANRPDFFGLNHYGTGFYSSKDGQIEPGLAMGKSTWLFMSGWGFRKLLNWVSNRYGKEMPIYCTEGGWSVEAKTALEGKYDPGRVMYYFQYLQEAHKAIHEDGVNLQGYYAWSIMDNYEWELGYSERFGINFNDFQFGEIFSDPDSPNDETPVYDANTGKLNGRCGDKCVLGNGNLAQTPDPKLSRNQTRHAKNSALYLQWIWQTNTVVNPARFLAGSIGGDICYGHGIFKDGGSSVQCKFDWDVPGKAPLEEYGCADDLTPCNGVPCCNSEYTCTSVNAQASICLQKHPLVV